jgi:hypothetical protein
MNAEQINQLKALGVAVQKNASLLDAISGKLPAPKFVGKQPYLSFRHEEQDKTIELAVVLKAVKAISALNACLCLMIAGHAQEIMILLRVVEECCNDILFLMIPDANGNNTEKQEEYLRNFFAEEFADASQVLTSHQSRAAVPFKKINAANAKTLGQATNERDAAKMSEITFKTLSGYVHAAYPQIMEMYGGPDLKFHMRGMLNTPRIEETLVQLINYVDRININLVLLCRCLGFTDHEAIAKTNSQYFENQFNTRSQLTPAQMLAQLKNR